MPILTYESDGYAVPPVFLRQVEVHVQQVLDAFRASGGDGKRRRRLSWTEARNPPAERIPV
jgi:hypothetical protein